MLKRILLTGGPSSGKTTIIHYLRTKGYYCLEEISREVIKNGQKEGIAHFFLEKPLLFSQLLKEARVQQFLDAKSAQASYVFFDRGIPDTVAYLDYIKQEYPDAFTEACKAYTYDKVFILPPWEEIHRTDNERYESFDQAKAIHKALLKTYATYKYRPIKVPFGAIAERANFIISKLKD